MKVDNSAEWQARDGRTPIPMEKWGRDHWSLFGYVETCEVDFHGLLDWDLIQVSARNWPMLWNVRSLLARSGSKDGADYGLRLKLTGDGSLNILKGHCEVDALMDLVDAGLVTITMPKPDKEGDYFLKPNGRPLRGENYVSPKFVTGAAEWELMPWASFRLTTKGREIANRLRAHKANPDASWSGFDPEATL